MTEIDIQIADPDCVSFHPRVAGISSWAAGSTTRCCGLTRARHQEVQGPHYVLVENAR